MENVFIEFRKFIQNMEEQLLACEDKGLVLESNLVGLIQHFNKMRFQIQSDFKTIKNKPRNNIKNLHACQRIIEFVLMNTVIDNELVASFFGISIDKEGNQRIKLLT